MEWINCSSLVVTTTKTVATTITTSVPEVVTVTPSTMTTTSITIGPTATTLAVSLFGGSDWVYVAAISNVSDCCERTCDDPTCGIYFGTIIPGLVALAIMGVALWYLKRSTEHGPRYKAITIGAGVAYSIAGSIMVGYPEMSDDPLRCGKKRALVISGSLLLMWGIIFAALSSLEEADIRRYTPDKAKAAGGEVVTVANGTTAAEAANSAEEREAPEV